MLKCGGCAITQTTYAEQLAQKQQKVAALLQPFCNTLPIIGMADPYHYRNKVHAVCGTDRRGHLITGLYEAGSHRIVPVDRCLIENERAGEIVRQIRDLAQSFRLRAFDEVRREGTLRRILVRTAQATGEIMVVLITGSPVFPSRKNFVHALLQRCPDITTVIHNINDRRDSLILGEREQVLSGRGTIEDLLCGKRFRISAQSFYQINPVQTEVLYNQAVALAGLTGRERVVDAYCGIGTIGLAASGQAKDVIGVEVNPDAVRDARTNARINAVTNARFYPGDAGEFLQKMASAGETADVVFLDPPRAGSTPEFIAALRKMAPSRIVYISCDPVTLARDLQLITAGGYVCAPAQPVDMFPGTEHVESVVMMSHQNS